MTLIASMYGGSPKALLSNTLFSRWGSVYKAILKRSGISPVAVNMLGAGGAVAVSRLVVPHQLLGGEPTHALHKAALNLPDVDRNVSMTLLHPAS